ncbi:MAG TPA: exopolysaccharide biosynthesis polyprenyl glycosylphosphotransferase, partial [Crocinitomicaceae bacterium]|nr:exopolysaccharide biosynthesis polyprenyl glycosylphosphotransferase [Crocinitomicaceae bacterium]
MATSIPEKSFDSTIIFFGYSTEVKYLFDQSKAEGISCLGIYDDKQRVDGLGTVSAGIQELNTTNVNRVICSGSKISSKDMNAIITHCENNNIELLLVADGRNSLLTKDFSIVKYKNVITYKLNPIPLNSFFNRFVKSTFDFIFSLFVIVFVLSWLYLIVGILIKLSSKGPILFKQKRNGKDNKEFWCYKFRSMVVNKESDQRQANANDKRITKIGAFLRKTSLDELPQFLNVLKGDMSVVGPRPHMIKHNQDYEKLIDSYNYRTHVKPGITGLAQVMGHRGETESDIYLMKIRVRVDRFYIQN